MAREPVLAVVAGDHVVVECRGRPVLNLLRMPVVEPWQVEIMRQLYNDAIPELATMSRLPYRSATEQQSWWANRAPGTKAFLYLPIETPWAFVAFSLLTPRGKLYSPVFAIRPEWRGRGFAREIIQHYLDMADGPLVGSQRIDNARIRELNRDEGWEVIQTVSGFDGSFMVEQLYHPGRRGVRQQEIFDEIVRYHEAP